METAKGREFVTKSHPAAAYDQTLFLRNLSRPYKNRLPVRTKDANQKKNVEEYKQELENENRLKFTRNADFVDTVNMTPVTNVNRGTGIEEGQDFVNFQFRVTQYNEEGQPERRFIKFRATFADINDTITPNWNETKFIGRSDKVYTYSGTDREMQISFKIFPKSVQEFPFLVEKLNMLAGANYPQYTKSDFMIGPLVDLKLGDMYDFVPGYLTSFSMNIVESSTWELDLFEFPKNIDVSLGFRYIGKRRPHGLGAQFDIPYFNPNKGNQSSALVGEGDQALESSIYNGSMYLTQKELDSNAANGTKGRDTSITRRRNFDYSNLVEATDRPENIISPGVEMGRPKDQESNNAEKQTEKANQQADGTDKEGSGG